MDMPAFVACKVNNFEDGSQYLYRFLEYDPVVPKYYNFRDQQTTASPSRKIEYQKNLSRPNSCWKRNKNSTEKYDLPYLIFKKARSRAADKD